MDLRSALRSLINDSTYTYAVKRSSWKGYIYRVKIDDPEGAYKFVFRYSDGTETAMTVGGDDSDTIRVSSGVVYKGATGTTEATAVTDYVPLSTFLLDALLNGTDFDVGLKSDFDAASAGSGEF